MAPLKYVTLRFGQVWESDAGGLWQILDVRQSACRVQPYPTADNPTQPLDIPTKELQSGRWRLIQDVQQTHHGDHP